MQRAAAFRSPVIVACLAAILMLPGPAGAASLPSRVIVHARGTLHHPLRKGPTVLRPAAGPGTPIGYIPCDIANAYRLGTTSLNGTGVTIAIVDAFDDSSIASDLSMFDQAFGLPAATFNVFKPFGASAPPPSEAGWITEISLDVEWAHAVAPGATIDLVEAPTNSVNDLLNAVFFASHNLNNPIGPAPDVVSMSWG